MTTPSCPLPRNEAETVLLAHGSGGRLSLQLIEQLFLTHFDNSMLQQRHDGAAFAVEKGRLAISTDSYVVRPLTFPGGDIGTLAVTGTCNDLAMCGARPLYLTAGFILEEGLAMKKLASIAASMRKQADMLGVHIVAGDTKVVERGKGDEVFINTTGVGLIEHAMPIAPASVRAGDAVLISGDIGRHGLAILLAREELGLASPLESDCAPLWPLVEALLKAEIEIHCLRDLTRGGLAAALVEIGQAAALGMAIDEVAIPVCDEVREPCELLGIDPKFAACEGRMVVILPQSQADKALALLRSFPAGAHAAQIGVVEAEHGVRMQGPYGVERRLLLPAGEQLPRIC